MTPNVRAQVMRKVHRIVVKVGTSSLTRDSGELDFERMGKLVGDICALVRRDIEVVLVSSGAVAAGSCRLALPGRPGTIPEKQAAAAVGQGILVNTYEQLFDKYDRAVGQILLTRADFASRYRFLNARNTLSTLLQYGVIPIVNENDTVAVEEIQVGENDRLSALVACLVDSALLVILTDTDGVFTCDPKTNQDAQLISLIEDVGPGIDCLGGNEGSVFGTGGMNTKIQAAKIAAHSGIPVVIANASNESVLQRIVDGELIGTMVLPGQHRLHAKKRWIGFGSEIEGKIFVDGGAEKAVVEAGKSLLPSGVTGTEGTFMMGSVVSVIGSGGREIAKGIVNYSADEIELIKGKHTGEIENVLGYRSCHEVIHRDNLTVTV